MADIDLFNTFFRTKPALMLVELRKSEGQIYTSNVAKVIDCTYSHAVSILSDMEKGGLVNFEKKGRLKLLNLTKKGAEIADHIIAVRNSLKQN